MNCKNVISAKPKQIWFWLRMILMLLAICVGFLSFMWGKTFVFGEMTNLYFIIILGCGILSIILAPLAILGVIGMLVGMQMLLKPNSAKPWQLPNWERNFLNFQEPILFFHFTSWFIIFGGIGRLFGAFILEWRIDLLAICWLLGGISSLIGVRLCPQIYKSTFSSNGVVSAENLICDKKPGKSIEEETKSSGEA